MTNKVKGTCVPVEYLVLGMLENNVYIISDGKATIVVDPHVQARRDHQGGGGSVDAIILTHRHSDHVGAAKELRDKTGATVIASAIDAPIISGEKKLPRDDMRFTPCPVDHVVNDGDILKDRRHAVEGDPDAGSHRGRYLPVHRPALRHEP